MTFKRLALFMALTFTIPVLGCGGEGRQEMGTAPVSGTVTHNSVPVAGATVTFHATTTERSAFGRSDEAGNYQLTCYSSNDGALPGEYNVTVTKVEFPPGANLSEDHPDYGKQPIGPDPEPQSLLPKKYGNPNTSGITVTVKEGRNAIPLELTD